jgi:hypothetical protein
MDRRLPASRTRLPCGYAEGQTPP